MTLTIPLSVNRTYRIAVSVFFFIAGFVFASWASRIPDIKNQLQLSDGGLGSVLLALPIGLMTGLPLAGFLVSRFGSKKIMIAGALLYPSILLLLGLAATPFQLAAALFMFGFCGNLLNIAVNTQAIGVEAIYGRSIMASFHGLWSLAGFIGAAVSTIMLSFKLTPFIHFVIISIASALLIFQLINTRSRRIMAMHNNLFLQSRIRLFLNLALSFLDALFAKELCLTGVAFILIKY